MLKYCKRCGLITEEDMQLCPSCGNKLYNYVPQVKKKWLVPFCLLFLVVLLSLIGFLVLSFSSKRNKESTAKELSNAIAVYIRDESFGGESLPLIIQYHNAILGEITYDIQTFDLAQKTMNVEFTYIDVLHMADSFTDSSFSGDDYYSRCIEMINSQEYHLITEVIPVSFESQAGAYSVIATEPLTNVLSGGVLSYYLELLEEIDYE